MTWLRRTPSCCRELVHSFKDPDYVDVTAVYEGGEIEKLRADRGF